MGLEAGISTPAYGYSMWSSAGCALMLRLCSISVLACRKDGTMIPESTITDMMRASVAALSRALRILGARARLLALLQFGRMTFGLSNEDGRHNVSHL